MTVSNETIRRMQLAGLQLKEQIIGGRLDLGEHAYLLAREVDVRHWTPTTQASIDAIVCSARARHRAAAASIGEASAAWHKAQRQRERGAFPIHMVSPDEVKRTAFATMARELGVIDLLVGEPDVARARSEEWRVGDRRRFDSENEFVVAWGIDALGRVLAPALPGGMAWCASIQERLQWHDSEALNRVALGDDEIPLASTRVDVVLSIEAGIPGRRHGYALRCAVDVTSGWHKHRAVRDAERLDEMQRPEAWNVASDAPLTVAVRVAPAPDAEIAASPYRPAWRAWRQVLALVDGHGARIASAVKSIECDDRTRRAR